MGQYWYFAATLPVLQPGASAPMSSSRFLELCRKHLSEGDFAAVEVAELLSPPEASPAEANACADAFLAAYYGWERCLRNELARARAKHLNRAAEPWLRPAGMDERAHRSARAALDAGTPLEGELIFERERWAMIEDLRGLRIFDMDAILAYRLQLQVLERLARLSVEAGEARYMEIYAAILGGANANVQTGDDR